MFRRNGLMYAGLAFLLVTGSAEAQDTLRWEADLATAQQAAAQTNRLVLVHFGAAWCPACVEMERNVLARPGLGTALAPFYVFTRIEVPADFNHPLVKQFGVDSLPCDVLTAPQGQVVQISKGPKTAEQFVGLLNSLAQSTLAAGRSTQSGGVLPASNVAPLPAASSAMPTTQRYSTVYQGTSGATPPPSFTPPAAATYGATQLGAVQQGAGQTAANFAGNLPANSNVRPVGVERTPTSGDRYSNYYNNRGMTPPPPPLFNGAGQATPLVSPPPALQTATLPPANLQPVPTMNGLPDNQGRTLFVPLSATQPAPQANTFPAPIVPPVSSSVPSLPIPAVPAQPKAPELSPPPSLLPTAPQLSEKSEPADLPQAPAREVVQTPTQVETPKAAPLPPVALDGYCPVCVTEKMVWSKGDPRFGAIHRGRVYLFASIGEQAKFLENPDRYSPIISGNDPVAAIEQGVLVAGKREFGMMCEGRMILFSSKANYDKFVADRSQGNQYLTALHQALAAAGDTRR